MSPRAALSDPALRRSDLARKLGLRDGVVVAFFEERAGLEQRLPALVRGLDPDGALWIAWPKRSSGVESDLSDDAVRELGLAAGLVDNKVCAFDEAWSALRFVYRLADRPPTSG